MWGRSGEVLGSGAVSARRPGGRILLGLCHIVLEGCTRLMDGVGRRASGWCGTGMAGTLSVIRSLRQGMWGVGRCTHGMPRDTHAHIRTPPDPGRFALLVQALEFVWSADSNEYAVRESASKVKVFKNFQVGGWERRSGSNVRSG